MNTQEVDTVIHEANGVCSALDIEIFRAWKKVFRHTEWTRAEVASGEGLTLFDESRSVPFGLHFSETSCGYGGEGPRAAVTILLEAGFGSREDLEKVVFHQQSARFTK